MSMSKRVAKLRKLSLDKHPGISAERALLMTAFYKTRQGNLSVPMERALSFRYLMEHKTIYIGEDELIVGEKGSSPKASPTYPELCCHSLQDLDILNDREKVSFDVSSETRSQFAEEIIPFWKNKSMREMIFQEMDKQWLDCYSAGIFTEFMEQRSPGHTVLDDKIYHKGMLDFQKDIEKSLKNLDYYNDPRAYQKREQLKAMHVVCGAIIRFAERHAEKARELASTESDPKRRVELEKIAEVCTRVPAHAPETFHEALQAYWFVHLGVTTELNPWDAYCPGHLDQHLYPFYQKETAEGSLTRETAEELLQCLWIKFNNQPAPPKVGITAAESNTYTDFAQINLGGHTPEGSDAVNEVTYIMLDVIEEMRLLQPSTSIQVSKRNSDQFIKRAGKIIRTGFGQPSIFNSELIVQELLRMGKSLEDARAGGSSGCVEVGAFGKENYSLTGYFNFSKVLEITLNNGLDPENGKQLGLKTGEPSTFTNFETLFEAFEKQLNHFINIKIRGNQIIEQLFAAYMPVPFLSVLTSDCITNGLDYHEGGARYNSTYIQGVGLGSITDMLTAIKFNVYDHKTIKFDELISALHGNFKGNERLRQMLLNRTPKYGNDDDYADDIMRAVFTAFFKAVDGRPTTKGGQYRVNMLPTTCHAYFGSVCQASADGRLAHKPLSEGVSPVQATDRSGPTAVLKSVAKMEHILTGGTLLNQKLTPKLLENDEGLDVLVQLVRSYFRMDGHHIQFNVVDADTLRDAQEHPEQHRDLIVRVAGYSDYFSDLGRELQDEIIARTEHQAY